MNGMKCSQKNIPKEWNEVLTKHYNKYGRLPFGQPQTTNISSRLIELTVVMAKWYLWLTVHGVGNFPRDHRVFELIDECIAYLIHIR